MTLHTIQTSRIRRDFAVIVGKTASVGLLLSVKIAVTTIAAIKQVSQSLTQCCDLRLRWSGQRD